MRKKTKSNVAPLLIIKMLLSESAVTQRDRNI